MLIALFFIFFMLAIFSHGFIVAGFKNAGIDSLIAPALVFVLMLPSFFMGLLFAQPNDDENPKS